MTVLIHRGESIDVVEGTVWRLAIAIDGVEPPFHYMVCLGRP